MTGVELYTTQQMRATEVAAIAAGAVSGRQLMERAGAAVAAEIERLVPPAEGAARRAVLLCGPGGNGGDGYVVARLLAHAGWRVAVLGLGDPAKAPPDAADARGGWEALGAVRPLADLPLVGVGAHVIVDALYGGGLKRPLPEGVFQAFDALQDAHHFAHADEFEMDEAAYDAAFPPQHRVAIDAPSGLCLDNGRRRGFTIAASVTITFHRPKIGHYVDEGPGACGRLVVADIGLEGFSQPGHRKVWLVGPPWLAAIKAQDGHKYRHGHVLVLAGGAGRGGAARLAARAALRVGAGLVTVAAPGAAMAENAARLDAVMLRRVDGPEDLAALLAEGRVNCVVMGPGLGVGAATLALLDAALEAQEGTLRLVLDADALTSLAERPDPRPEGDPETVGWRRDYRGRLGARVVLTPHMGEFRRLFPEYAAGWGPDDPERLMGKVPALDEVSSTSGCTVLLKGPDTLIADFSGSVSVCASVHDRAAPWLATAGAGDVLAGMIGGLMARGWAPRRAAGDAAWLHAEAARLFGPGLIAEDLPEMLPRVLRALET